MRPVLLPLLFAALLGASVLRSEPATVGAPAPYPDQWPAYWIAHPEAPANAFGVYLFRKEIELPEVPAHFVVHVTADARYRLFVNGRSVARGPQRSDLWVWRYDTVDLAPALKPGRNVIAAQVWSYGDTSPTAIIGVRTGFLLQGHSEPERVADTNATWQVRRDAAVTALPVPELNTYIVVGPGFRLDGTTHAWDWQSERAAPDGWSAAKPLNRGRTRGRGSDIEHALAPRSLPPMEETPIRFAAVRRATGVTVPDGFVRGERPLQVPARTRASVLLDQGVETNAFPHVVMSGGRQARVRLTYAEALFDAAGQKGNRHEVEGRHLAGLADEFVADGGSRRSFAGLVFRTYRYVQLDIETADEPLTIDDVSGVFTGYPFQERGSFASDDPSLAKVWEVGWRTARLCAEETYFDCPYYEQLQYVGDTRLQALISLYVAGDDRLMRNAIELYDRSRIAEGLTQSRYPSSPPQVINTFSLFWIEMVHDYWMHRPDAEFARQQLPGIEAVLGWFERHTDPQTGLVGPLTYWTFVDWTNEWAWTDASGIGGEPAGAQAGGSSIVSLQLARTYHAAARLERAFGRGDRAAHYEQAADGLRRAVMQQCWDDRRQLVADTPARTSFSQHTNALAVLAGAVDGEKAAALMRRASADRSLIQSSSYFRFYLLRAMKRAGLGDDYLAQLGPWREMLDRGLTTFAEKNDPTRSDCHAWSATPVYELLATVCGVEPAAPGFARVRIEPHLGPLRQARGTVPHPAGEIVTDYHRDAEGLHARVVLPAGVDGVLVWKGRESALHPGEQTPNLR